MEISLSALKELSEFIFLNPKQLLAQLNKIK